MTNSNTKMRDRKKTFLCGRFYSSFCYVYAHSTTHAEIVWIQRKNRNFILLDFPLMKKEITLNGNERNVIGCLSDRNEKKCFTIQSALLFHLIFFRNPFAIDYGICQPGTGLFYGFTCTSTINMCIDFFSLLLLTQTCNGYKSRACGANALTHTLGVCL